MDDSMIDEILISTGSQVLDRIDDIAAEGSLVRKRELLAELAGSKIGRFVLKWTYDPFITYGLTPPRQPSADSTNIEFRAELVSRLLTELSTRKLSGNAAQREVADVMASFNAKGAELLFRILSKDLKCGIAESTIHEVVPGLIPVFSVMRAHKFEEKRITTWPQIVEPKLDGYRFSFLCRDGQGGFFTRNGKRESSIDHLIEPMIETALAAVTKSGNMELLKTLSTKPGHAGAFALTSLSFMVDGEMIVDESFKATGALKRKSEKAEGARFHIFDIMSYADFDKNGAHTVPYLERRKLVEEFVGFATSDKITKTPRYFASSFDEIHDLYERFRARGLEGAMVKNPAGGYDKKKSHGWLKIKAEDTLDLPIVGFFNGEKHTKNENTTGGVIVDHNGVHVRVAGLSDDLRAEIHALWMEDAKTLGIPWIVGFKPGFTVDPALSLEGLKLLGRLIEVEFHEVTPDGSLRHPRFKRWRDDKRGEVESKEAA